MCYLWLLQIAYTDLCMTNQWACYLNDHLFMLMPKSKWGNFSGPIAEIAAEIINTQVRAFGNSIVQSTSIGKCDISYWLARLRADLFRLNRWSSSLNRWWRTFRFRNCNSIDLQHKRREGSSCEIWRKTMLIFSVGNISRVWRHKLTDYLTNQSHPPSGLLELHKQWKVRFILEDLLDFGVTHNESLPEGLQDVADALSPKFAGWSIWTWTISEHLTF